MKSLYTFAFSLLVIALFLGGCQQASDKHGTHKAAEDKPATGQASEEEADIKAARAELSPEDQRLVKAQDYCPVIPDKRLGVMGTPIKVMVKDQPVFLCCKGCQRKALADPDKTLAKVEELRGQ